MWFQNRRAKQRRHIKKEMGLNVPRKPNISKSFTPKPEPVIMENENNTWINSPKIVSDNYYSNFYGNGSYSGSTTTNISNNESISSQTYWNSFNRESLEQRTQQSSFCNYDSYTIAAQNYIHPNFINQEAMKMAFQPEDPYLRFT